MKFIAWLGVVLVGLFCVAAPVSVLAADDEQEHRELPRQMMPEQGHHGPQVCCGQRAGHGCRFLRCLAVVLAIIHVMLAGWVFTDIRKRGEGHGIFIILALLGGIPATILYALVRIGDAKRN